VLNRKLTRRCRRRLSRLAKKTTGSNTTVRQESTVVEQRNILRTRIKAWEQLYLIYMPGLLHYRTKTLPNNDAATANATLPSVVSVGDNPEEHDLWLPSNIPPADRPAVCQEGLADIEERLRTAQCQDALEGVRNILKIKTRMIAFKNRNIRGQREGTRSRAVIDRVHERARNMAQKYRASRAAKLELAGPGTWEETLLVLKDEDVRGYQDADRLRVRPGRRGTVEDEVLEMVGIEGGAMDEDDGILLRPQERTRRDGTGETRRTLSWIWTTQRAASSDDEQDDILRAEWSKSRARAARTWEEVLRLKEEMRRVLESLEWKSRWWKTRSESRDGVGKDVREGLKAYALGQSSIQLSLAEKFRELWKSPLADSAGESAGVQTKVGDASVQTEVGADKEDDDDEGDEEDGGEGGGYEDEDDENS